MKMSEDRWQHCINSFFPQTCLIVHLSGAQGETEEERECGGAEGCIRFLLLGSPVQVGFMKSLFLHWLREGPN
jgi:hypothetical protein